MVSLEKAVIARLEIKGERFEIYVDPELALAIKEGKDVDMDKVLASYTIFKDARKGEKASEEKINKIFGTTVPEVVAKEIIRRGEIQLTTEQRRRMLEQKRKQIATIISRNAINPQTNAPHPVERILKAMEEAKVNVDIFKDAEAQVENVVKAIKRIIPIKIEKKLVAVKVPAQFHGKIYGKIRGYGEIKKEEWIKDSWLFLIEIPSGLVDDFFEFLNKVTKGSVETKILEKR